ncbi:hypothetical protein HNQ80_000626 [Anaerosolibacter carboniphilus]|uniref:Uncharacterized protein n=1 Tax=Anaerosolibacter carboniphilus TaxID=1417629 RepID=A0A841KMB2_9FIRM|nr:hypothetical protein [Anaerosolibacter carboniphilus]MBB6214543.1 hypothetical protein [Anaerosolibacter carboniphilus]
MEVFNFISGLCSIVGLGVSIFAASKVIKIHQQISTKETIIHKNKMRDGNTVIGGDFYGSQHK